MGSVAVCLGAASPVTLAQCQSDADCLAGQVCAAGDDGSFNCVTPDLSIQKTCGDATIASVAISMQNTGDVDLANCLVVDEIFLSDPQCPADVGSGTVCFAPPAFNLLAGGTANVNGTCGFIDSPACNTVTITCDIVGSSATITRTADDECGTSGSMGSCCLPPTDGACLVTSMADCDAQGGSFLAEGDCTTPQGCCLQDGSCADLDPLCCVESGGDPQGTGTACSESEGCCLPNGSCEVKDPLCCLEDGGDPQGAGSDCATTDCQPGGGEGCTAGYWKNVDPDVPGNHLCNWEDPYYPEDLFHETCATNSSGVDICFEDAFQGKTLIEVLGPLHQRDGISPQLAALGFQTVPALLNAASTDVLYDIATPAEVIEMFNEVFPGDKEAYNQLKNTFAGFNESDGCCPLGNCKNGGGRDYNSPCGNAVRDAASIPMPEQGGLSAAPRERVVPADSDASSNGRSPSGCGAVGFIPVLAAIAGILGLRGTGRRVR